MLETGRESNCAHLFSFKVKQKLLHSFLIDSQKWVF